jgi:hypothetical protein
MVHSLLQALRQPIHMQLDRIRLLNRLSKIREPIIVSIVVIPVLPADWVSMMLSAKKMRMNGMRNGGFGHWLVSESRVSE